MTNLRASASWVGIILTLMGVLLMFPLQPVSMIAALLLMGAGCILAEWGDQTGAKRKARDEQHEAGGRG